MNGSVEFLPEARRDVIDASRWYESQQPGLGAAFLLAVEASIHGIFRVPEGHALVALRTRKVLVRRFPYLVFYVLEGERILVTGVFHARRNPTNWSDRVREGAIV